MAPYQGARYRGWCGSPDHTGGGHFAPLTESKMPWGCQSDSGAWTPGCAGTAASDTVSTAQQKVPLAMTCPSQPSQPSQVTTYNCNNGKCKSVVGTGGKYPSLTECRDDCKAPATSKPPCAQAPVSTKLQNGVGSWWCDDDLVGHISTVSSTANSYFPGKTFICCPAVTHDGIGADGNAWAMLPHPYSGSGRPALADWGCSTSLVPKPGPWSSDPYKARLNHPPLASCPGESCSADNAVNNQYCAEGHYGWICGGDTWYHSQGGYGGVPVSTIGTLNDSCS